MQFHAKDYQFDTKTSEIKICIICLHFMLLLIIEIKIFIIAMILIMFVLLPEQATSNLHGPYERPGSCGTILVTPGLGLGRY